MTEDSILPSDKKLCECGCGQIMDRRNKWGRKLRFKPGHCPRGKNHWNWKGGNLSHSDATDYRRIWKPDHPRADKKGYVYEHIVVMEEMLGRYLTDDEEVHHINGKKYDNRKENLDLFATHGDHMRAHRGDMSNRKCANCGATEETAGRHWHIISPGVYACRKKACYRYALLHRKKNAESTN